MLLQAAAQGRLDEVLDAEQLRVAHSIQGAVHSYGDDVKERLRDDVRGAGFKNNARVPNTWRANNYPRRPNRSMEPASLVFSTAPTIIRAFEEGQVIRSRQGRFEIVPNYEVWPRGRVTGSRTGMSGRSDTFAAGVRKFGPLQFLRNRNRPGGRFVARVRANKGSRGGFRKVREGQRADTTIVVFWAVPQVRQPKLLQGREIRRKVEREAPGQIEGRFRRAMELRPSAAAS